MQTQSRLVLFERVCELLKQGDSRANELLPCLQRYNDYAPGWVRLAQTLSQLDKPEAAAEAYERALAGRNPPAAAAIGKVDLMLSAGRLALAKTWLSAHRGRWPDSPAISYTLGRVHYRLGEYEAAQAAFENAVDRAPDFAEAWFQIGLIAQDTNCPAAAAAAYRQALSAQSAMPEAALNLGISLQAMGDIDAALDAYSAAFRARPESFNRIAQALTSAPTGRLWLNPRALRRALEARA